MAILASSVTLSSLISEVLLSPSHPRCVNYADVAKYASCCIIRQCHTVVWTIRTMLVVKHTYIYIYVWFFVHELVN
jgi:hypothetical protein